MKVGAKFNDGNRKCKVIGMVTMTNPAEKLRGGGEETCNLVCQYFHRWQHLIVNMIVVPFRLKNLIIFLRLKCNQYWLTAVLHVYP